MVYREELINVEICQIDRETRKPNLDCDSRAGDVSGKVMMADISSTADDPPTARPFWLASAQRVYDELRREIANGTPYRTSLDCGCVTAATQGRPDNRFTVESPAPLKARDDCGSPVQ